MGGCPAAPAPGPGRLQPVTASPHGGSGKAGLNNGARPVPHAPRISGPVGGPHGPARDRQLPVDTGRLPRAVRGGPVAGRAFRRQAGDAGSSVPRRRRHPDGFRPVRTARVGVRPCSNRNRFSCGHRGRPPASNGWRRQAGWRSVRCGSPVRIATFGADHAQGAPVAPRSAQTTGVLGRVAMSTRMAPPRPPRALDPDGALRRRRMTPMPMAAWWVMSGRSPAKARRLCRRLGEAPSAADHCGRDPAVPDAEWAELVAALGRDMNNRRVPTTCPSATTWE